MSYRVIILPRSGKELAEVPHHLYGAIRDAIRELAVAPRPHGCRKLKGYDGWRIRVGTYRVVYKIDDLAKTVTVMQVAHRRDVYR